MVNDYRSTKDGFINADIGTYTILQVPESAGWTCYLFGTKPGFGGFVYKPSKGQVPNFFVRWMMKVLLGCMWIKDLK
jgi:hypothetical protein